MTQTSTVLQWMLEAIRWSASADNTQPWRFYVQGESIQIWFAPSPHSFALSHPASLLSLGMLQENCEQMAAALDISLRIEMPAHFQEEMPVCILHFPGEALERRVELYPPALLLRHTNRLPFLRKPLEPELVGRMSDCGSGDCHIQLMNGKAKMAPWIPLLRRGSELRFQTKEAHLWLDASLRMTPPEVNRGDGLDVATFHLPPGGRALLGLIRDWRRMSLLNKIGFYQLLALIEADLVKQAPALLLISGPAGEKHALSAGRAMARSWIKLNQLGCAVQPYFVVPDQLFRLQKGGVDLHLLPQVNQLAESVRALLPANDVLYMMLRVGYPKKEPVKSRRLAIEQLRHS